MSIPVSCSHNQKAGVGSTSPSRARKEVVCQRVTIPLPYGRGSDREIQLKDGQSRARLIGARAFGVLIGITLSASGCTFSGGELLYVMGFGKGELVEAKYQLTEEPILILIDDPSQQISDPFAIRHLFEQLAQELLKNEAAKKLIPQKTLANLRQSVPNFEQKGCREIGLAAGAEEVIWIEVSQFFANEQIEEVIAAAYFRVTVKVINVLETKRSSRVRVWPTSPRGHQVSVQMTASEASIAKTSKEIGKELGSRLAVKIGKIFYDYRLGDFERLP